MSFQVKSAQELEQTTDDDRFVVSLSSLPPSDLDKQLLLEQLVLEQLAAALRFALNSFALST